MTDRYKVLLDQMRADTLHTCDFSHADHIGVAYQALEEEPFFEALALFARGIQGAAARAGAADKFNATVTLAFMSLLAERRACGTYAGAQEFVQANGDLRRKGLLHDWYSPTRLASATARKIAILPDRSGPAARPVHGA